MSDSRLIHRKASQGDRVKGLDHLSFRVWVQYILSADDYGVMRASASVLQADNRNLDREPTRRVQRAMDAITSAGLVETFVHQGETYWWQVDWQDFQQLKYPRDSVHPAPPEADLERATEATRTLFRTRVPGHSSTGQQEARLRDAIARTVRHVLTVGVSTVETEYRLGNSYCDAVVTLTDGRVVAVEVKRHPLTQAALNQVRRYRDALAAITPARVSALLVCRQGRPQGRFDHHDVTLAEFDGSFTATIEACQEDRLLFHKQWVLFDRANDPASAGGRETHTPTQAPTVLPPDREESPRETTVAVARPIRPTRSRGLAGNHMGCYFAPEACARGLCVPSWLGLEWAQQFADPVEAEADIRGFVVDTLARLPDGPVGDEPKAFWRAAWKARHGSASASRAGSRTGDTVDAAREFLRERVASLTTTGEH
jgi:hypothetical protein